MKHIKSLALAATVSITATVGASAATLIDNSTTGLYNDGIGNVLNGTDPFFVPPGVSDPTVTLASAPDTSAAAASLGAWLTTPATPGGTWSATEVAIPSSWAVESETAIIYRIDGGATGLTNVVASFGVDNGIAVWLNGVFVGGNQRPGGASLGEHVYTIGDIGSGINYLQVLREDHGGGTGYSVSVTGDDVAPIPLPAGMPLLVGALVLVGLVKTRRA